MLREKIVRTCMFLLRVGMGGFFLFVAGRKLLHLDQLQATIDLSLIHISEPTRH